jgi:hypothetical protein
MGFKDDMDYDNKELFLRRRHEKLKRYLTAVYPVAKTDIEKMDLFKLDEFYNSLWFYYNCGYTGQTKLGDIAENDKPIIDSTDKPVEPNTSAYGQSTREGYADIACWGKVCDVELPYAPDGLVYSWKHWNDNWSPMIISDKTMDTDQIGGSIPGQTFINGSMGPSPVWQYGRAILRNIYTPFDKKDRKVPYVLKGKHSNIDPPFKMPRQWWKGVPSNGYIEVNAASEPGLAQSVCPIWYDGWIGSGVFLDVGKTIIGRNKSNAVYLLAKEMESAKPGGKKLLQEWFNAENAEEALRNIFLCKISHPTFDIGGVNKEFDICTPGLNVTNSARLPTTKVGWDNPIKSNIPREWCRYLKEAEIKSNDDLDECLREMMYGGSFDADRVNTSTVWDEPLFAMGSVLDYDTIQMVMSANTNSYWQYEILDVRYTKQMPGIVDRNYSSFIKGPSLRNPFDLSKSSPCEMEKWDDMHNISPAWEGNKTVNLVCKNNLSSMFSKLALTDCSPSCSEFTEC